MRHEAAWIFGAVCPARDTGVVLVVPEAGVPAMQALLDELAANLPPDRHAVLVMDRAGWHVAHRLLWPRTITPLHLPAYSPELNPIERVWLYLRERFLSHRLFETYDAIVDACCKAWNTTLAETGRIARWVGQYAGLSFVKSVVGARPTGFTVAVNTVMRRGELSRLVVTKKIPGG